MAHRNRWFTWVYLGLPIKNGDFPWLCYINNQSVGFLMYAIAAVAAIAVSHRKAAHTGTTWRRSMTSGEQCHIVGRSAQCGGDNWRFETGSTPSYHMLSSIYSWDFPL